MKKIFSIILCVLITIVLLPICLGFNKKNYPHEYYNVYLDSNFLGTIASEEELFDYIDANAEKLINQKNIIKTYCSNELSLKEVLKNNNLEMYDDEKKYYKNNSSDCIDITLTDGTTIEKIYKPEGLKIEKIMTYDTNLIDVKTVYSKIVELKSFTVKGYEFTIKSEDKSNIIYVLDKQVFEDAVNNFISIYVGEKDYELYLSGNQEKIDTVGSIIENIYIDEDISVKEKQISVDKKIYTSVDELTDFLIFGNNNEIKKYKVKKGEMLSDVAYANEISNEEFLISNPKYKNANSLITAGTVVTIKPTSPQLSVVIEKNEIEDKEVKHKVIYQYDSEKYVGYKKTLQNGDDGLQRINQKIKIVNGNIVYVAPNGKETLKNSIDEIIVIGEKKLPNVGDLDNWAWPSDSGWKISSDYGYRIHPITKVRSIHNGIDIAGTGYNSPVYAANNGTVIIKKYADDFGYYIVIDHNNGYYTLYAHLNKYVNNINIGDTVIRGQQIGYVGSTGQSTGPHIHFEVWKNCRFCRISPWNIYSR